jgi:gas vesicle protein
MDIASKYKIVEKIIQTDDDLLLNEIKSLVGLSEGDFWRDVSVEVKQSVNKAKEELDRGEGIPHSQVMSEIKQRFLKK